MSVRIIAHRGARDVAPENTLASVRAALALEVDAIEFDVDLTADNRAILVHQETLVLDSSGTKLELARADEARAWTQGCSCRDLVRIDAGSWFDERWKEERIPELSAVLALPSNRHVFQVELKDPFFWRSGEENRRASAVQTEKILEAVLHQLEAARSAGRGIEILSFNHHLLARAAELAPRIPRVLALWTDVMGDFERHLEERAGSVSDYVVVAEPMAFGVPDVVRIVEARGLACGIYEVSPDANAMHRHTPDHFAARRQVWSALAERGVRSITTDFPAECCRWRADTNF